MADECERVYYEVMHRALLAVRADGRAGVVSAGWDEADRGGQAPGGWSPEAGPALLGGDGGTALVLEGATFCVSRRGGDIAPDSPHGLFVADTRIVSRWQLAVDGQRVEPLITLNVARYRATFVGRTRPRPGRADSTLLVLRNRWIDGGMHEEITLRNLGHEAAGVLVTLAVDADLADLFEVKEGRVTPHPAVQVTPGTDMLAFRSAAPADGRGMQLDVAQETTVTITPGLLSWAVVVPPRAQWSTSLTVHAVERAGSPPARPDPDRASGPAGRLEAWRLASPRIETPDAALATTLRTSRTDLGALQINDPDHPQRRVVAAGAPWFMALFGRDSLLTSWMALPLDQSLALGTLQALAQHQGTREEPLTEEQPGRILHEMRFGREAQLALGGGNAYYGTADATPLFVALLGELHRWGLPATKREELMPAADRALAWIERYGDRDGDGFVEYQRCTDRGLANQGWKDSFDGINDAAGRIAQPPVALCEVQGYVYAAYLARAELADARGDGSAEAWRERATRLKAAFNERYWLPDRGWYAVALDGDKRPVDALTSNIAHCLWTGIVDDEHAAAVVDQLNAPPMRTGFGLRTLASTMGAYNPMSYHNGSVWPHDTAIAVAGLMRYGFTTQAQQLGGDVLAAAAQFGGRLPELFCGFDHNEFPTPIPYPTSCSPQAWSAAAPLLIMRTLARLDPDLPHQRITLGPVLPSQMLPLRIEQLPIGDMRLTIEVNTHEWRVTGVPDRITVRSAG
jgi:glycogen debranching enzyme